MFRMLFASLVLALAIGTGGCTTYNVSPGWGGGWHGGGWGHTNVFVANTHSYYHPGRW